MVQFNELRDFERRFETMSVAELKNWKIYWTKHAQQLASKIRKSAMKRVHKIERVIELKTRHL